MQTFLTCQHHTDVYDYHGDPAHELLRFFCFRVTSAHATDRVRNVMQSLLQEIYTDSQSNTAKQAHRTAVHTLVAEILTQVCVASLSVPDAGHFQTSRLLERFLQSL